MTLTKSKDALFVHQTSYPHQYLLNHVFHKHQVRGSSFFINVYRNPHQGVCRMMVGRMMVSPIYHRIMVYLNFFRILWDQYFTLQGNKTRKAGDSCGEEEE